MFFLLVSVLKRVNENVTGSRQSLPLTSVWVLSIDKIIPQVASYIAKGLHVNWLPSSQYKEMTNIMSELSKNDISANLREVLEVL